MARFHLKFATYNTYMNITSSKDWPCARLSGKGHTFSIVDTDDAEKNSLAELEHHSYYKIKTHNTTHSNYEYAYSSEEGWIYCDIFSNNEKQLWKLHKNGNQVAFENVYWPGSYLGAEDGSWCSTEKRVVWWVPESA